MVERALPDSAIAAWQAYNAMETTKQRHFTLLAALEDRYGSAARAGGPEASLLAELLHDHDAQVARFTSAMAALKSADPPAHEALLTRLREINAALARYGAVPGGQSLPS